MKTMSNFLELVTSTNNTKQATIFKFAAGIFLSVLLFKQSWDSFHRRRKKKLLYAKLSLFHKARKDKIKAFFDEHSAFLINKPLIDLILGDKTINSLTSSLKTGKYTVTQVTLVYLSRALSLGYDNCWIADFNIEETLRTAKELDLLYNNTKDKKTLPALFGVPVSLKDSINIQGFRTTYSYIRYIDNVCESDSYLVSILKQKGAVPLIKSNVPQGYMAYDSWSEPFGRALNPLNKEFMVGGSSGGEAGLVASQCSMVGIGSDLGGSIRIPALFCGLYGFKPSSNRLSQLCNSSVSGRGSISVPYIEYSYGPIARNIEDSITICKELFGAFPIDNICDQRRFNTAILSNSECTDENKRKEKITVGYYLENTSFVETPSCIKSQISKLVSRIKEGQNSSSTDNTKPYPELSSVYTFKEIDISSFLNDSNSLFYKGYELLMNSYCLDQIRDTLTLDGEEPLYFLSRFDRFNRTPNIVRSLINKAYSLIGEKRYSHYYGNCRTVSNTRAYITLINEVQSLKNKFLQFLEQNEVDVLITPTAPYGAIHKDLYEIDTFIMKANFLFNLLDFPACNLPIGLINDVTYETKYRDSLASMIKENMRRSKGMPIGMQIASYKGKDELVLRVMKDFDRVNHHNALS